MRRVLFLLVLLILLSSVVSRRAAVLVSIRDRPVSVNDIPANGVQPLPLEAVDEVIGSTD